MAKYRQIGREVEAVQSTNINESREACLELAGVSLDYGSWGLAGDSLRISLPSGHQITLNLNSWLAKDENGYCYCESNEQFQKNHELIKE